MHARCRGAARPRRSASLRSAAPRLGAALALAVLAAGPGRADEPANLSVHIVSPDTAELLVGHTTLRAVVDGPPGRPAAVTFVVDGKELATDREPPYEAVWIGIDPLRDHLIRVTATGADGRRAYDLFSVPILGPVERISVTGRSPDFVLVDVTFTDPQGRPVVDVKREELQVTEDGEPQSIDVFAPDDRPMAVELLLDASGSTQPYWKDLGESTGLFAQTLRAGDRATVVAFNNKFYELAPLGSSPDAIRAATSRFDGWGGSTRLYDALARGGLFNLGREDTRRRALIVLTDAQDVLSSTLDGEDADDYLRRAEVEMHAVLLAPATGPLGGVGYGADIRYRLDLLKRMALDTGGAYYDNASLPMTEVFLRIGERLRAQYLLGYTSTSGRTPGRERKLEVRLNRPGGFEAHVRRSHFGGQTLTEYLAAEMNRGPERRRIMAVQTAALSDDPSALAAVVAALGQGRDMRSGVSREARLALLDRGEGSIAALRDGLGSGDKGVRPRVAEVLVDLFVRLAEKPDAGPLGQALATLGGGDAAAGRRRLADLGQLPLTDTAKFRLDDLLATLAKK
jgi:Ca-activated chloride channel family protein